MVYNQNHTLPTFPAGQPPLFVPGAGGRQVLNAPHTPEDLRDMLHSYVQQVVDATMVQNAAARARYGQRVVTAWDVTNEVVKEDAQNTAPQLGFTYRDEDPWHNNGPSSTQGSPGYDYVGDIYRWAAQEMTADAGKTIASRKITAADGFLLYYNEYNLEWKASKTATGRKKASLPRKRFMTWQRKPLIPTQAALSAALMTRSWRH